MSRSLLCQGCGKHLEVPDDYSRRKVQCSGCGVYCAVSTSLFVQKPVSLVSKEIVNRAKRIPGLIKQAVRSSEPTQPAAPTSPAQPTPV